MRRSGPALRLVGTAEYATHQVRRTALAEGIAALDAKPVPRGDTGAMLKTKTVLAMLHWLGIRPSCSRPRVSNDSAYGEALVRTAKYRPDFPVDLDAARLWGAKLKNRGVMSKTARAGGELLFVPNSSRDTM